MSSYNLSSVRPRLLAEAMVRLKDVDLRSGFLNAEQVRSGRKKDLLNGHNVVGDNAVRVFIGGQFSAENFKIVLDRWSVTDPLITDA